MISNQFNGEIPMLAGEALEQYRQVKLHSTTYEVVYADAGEIGIGFTQEAVADAAYVTVRPKSFAGTHLVTAADTFAWGATLYSAADGKVSDTVSGSPIGFALEAATAAGDVVAAILFAQLATTAAGTSIADAGGFTSTTTVEAALQEIYQDLLSAQCFINIPLATVLEGDATNVTGYLGPATTPKIDMLNGDTDSALGITWAASDSTPVLMQVSLPPDIDVTADVVLHFRGKMGGATDTPTIASDSYFNEGDTKVEDVSSAMTASYAENSITIAAADVPAGAQTLTVELTPGAHTTDTLIITSFWLEYTRAIRTS